MKTWVRMAPRIKDVKAILKSDHGITTMQAVKLCCKFYDLNDYEFAYLINKFYSQIAKESEIKE